MTAAKRPPLPAKLLPPRVLHTLARERLFSWLDGHSTLPLIWLAGAPGAGKTTLAASWLRARERRFAWYRLDSDDNDSGQFFVTLGIAADALVGKRLQRPAFAAELTNQPQHHARAWFRAVFAKLPRPVVLVFDNLEQAALAALPALLASAVDEAPEGVTLLVTSRHAPPPELAALRLAGTLAELPPEALAFDNCEAQSYAQARGLDPRQVSAAARRLDGWAAGLSLIGNVAPTPNASGQAPHALFDYLARLFFDKLPVSEQQLLLRAALLPWVPVAWLATRTESSAPAADAQRLLDRLCVQHMFVERVEASEGLYRLHPLLRDFLRQRACREWTPAQHKLLLHEAASGFAAMGHSDVELDLLLEAGIGDVAADRLELLIEDRLARGHLDQLAAWFARLPPAVLEERAALQYGLARLCFLREDRAALDHYERACHQFAAQGYVRGQQLCAAGVLEWSYNSDSFLGHERWSALLRDAVPAARADGPGLQALRLLNGRLLACFFDGDFAAEAEQWTTEVLAVLAPGEAANERLLAAVTLLGCLERAKRWDDAQRVAKSMQDMLDVRHESPGLGPRLKILVRQQIAADLYRQTGEYGRARALAQGSRDDARELGFAVLEFEGQAIMLLAVLYEGNVLAAQGLLAELDAMADAGNVYHRRLLSQMRAWHALQLGHAGAAREQALSLRAAVAHSDMPARFQATWLLMAVFENFSGGAQDGACAELTRLAAQAEPGSRATLQVNLLALTAWREWRAGHGDGGLATLAQSWRLARELRYFQLLAPLRDALSDLASLAWERRIDLDFTEQLIRRRCLRPPSVTTLHWPWPLHILTLGQFALRVGDHALQFEGKAPKKPLALLKALIAFGADAVPEHRLTDALWPGEEADAAHDAFNVALHRLRKLLPRGAEIVRLHDGCVSLDAALCWIDCRAFDHAASRALDTQDASAVQFALALYRGHFLAAEYDAPWSVSARERMRGRLHRLVAHSAETSASAGRHEQALEHYRYGLEIDDLDEAFYRGAMRCLLALGRPSEGIAVHRRLERMLATQLGVAPSAESRALLQRLLAL